MVTALRAGTVEIDATSEDGQYKSDSTVKIVPTPSLSKQDIIAYPNPNYDEVRLTEFRVKQVGLACMDLMVSNLKG